MRPIITNVTHNVVCLNFCASVCLSVLITWMCLAKIAEPIEMPFGIRNQVGPRYHVSDDGQDSFLGMGSFGEVVCPIEKHWECLLLCMQQKGSFSPH